jgi:alpha-1,2-rhamnosyltransferase
MRLYVEVTHTHGSEMNTGIPRVVRNVLRNVLELEREEGIVVVPVVFRKGLLVAVSPASVLKNKAGSSGRYGNAAMKVVRRLGRTVLRGCQSALERLHLHSRCSVGDFVTAEPSERHVLLLLDASWAYDIWPAIEHLKGRGLRIVSVIYDLIPITHRHTVVESLASAFERWLSGQMRFSDGIVCISRSIAIVVEKHIEGTVPARSGRVIRVSSFHLGSELDFVDGAMRVQKKLLSLKSEGSPIFLMVGTIEPRKNHRQVLEVFQKLWIEGVNARLAVVGAWDWKSEELLSEMVRHPEAGRRLLLIRDASDVDLQWLYENATALIMASEVEGFGLPIVEARQVGLPVICSDIPVFAELAAPGTEFFRLGNVEDLSRLIRSHLASRRPRDRTAKGWITWRESARQLLAAIRLAVPDAK